MESLRPHPRPEDIVLTRSRIGIAKPVLPHPAPIALSGHLRAANRTDDSSNVAIPFVRPLFARTVLDCLGSRGVSPLDVLSHIGLDWQDLDDSSPWIDFSALRRLIAHAIAASGEPALGLIAGSMLQPYHGQLGIGAVTSNTLADGLQFTTRYAGLIFRTLEFQADTGPQWRTLWIRPKRPLCETQVFVTQFILGAYLRLIEAILGRPVHELRVGLPFDRPTGPDVPYMRYFRQVEFNCKVLTLQLPISLLATRSASADADAFLAAAQFFKKIESEIGHGDFVQRARQALLERLPDNPMMETLAQDLGVSGRTLVRRLSETGLNFSDLKDDLRKSHAVWYLQHTELPMETIASQLGYNDPSNFSRKFKSWYQVSPQHMRKTYLMGLEH